MTPCEDTPSRSAATKLRATASAAEEGIPTFEKRLETQRSSASVRIPLVGVEVGLDRVMRAVVDLDDDGVLVRDGRAVHVAFRVAVKAAGRQHGLRLGVLVLAFEAEHELVRRVRVRRRNAAAPIELDQRDR